MYTSAVRSPGQKSPHVQAAAAQAFCQQEWCLCSSQPLPQYLCPKGLLIHGGTVAFTKVVYRTKV